MINKDEIKNFMLFLRFFISCCVIVAIQGLNFEKVVNSPGVRYTPSVDVTLFDVPARRSISDSARDIFLNKLEQRVSAKLDEIDSGRPVSETPSYMSYEKRTKPKIFTEYEKRFFPGVNSRWTRDLYSYEDLH